MKELGLSFDERVQLIDRAAGRIDRDLQLVSREFAEHAKRLESCISGGSVFEFNKRSLESDLLLDLHSFLFELRCALELLEKFLLGFFEIVLGKKETKRDLRKRLKQHGMDDSWIRRLSTLRDLLTHNATPPVAFHVISTDPLRFELLILRAFPNSIADFPGATPLSELTRFYHGYGKSLDIIEQLLVSEIEAFESQSSA